MATFVQQITAETQDGLDTGSGWFAQDTPYTDAEFFSLQDNANDWRGGVRFSNVTIAQGATINSATMTLVRRDGTGTPTSIQIWGDDVDDAAVWGDSSRPQNGFTRTTASGTQTTLPSTNVSFTVDIASVIQELVDRGSWASGNDMRFEIKLNATYANFGIVDYDLAPVDTTGDAAQLDVDYTAAGGVAIPIMMHHYSKNIGSR